jgi:phosphoserine phosphatase RsbU/P
VSDEGQLDPAEDLYEDAPCGYLALRPDGTIVRVNRTFEAWTGHERAALAGRRFSDLLTAAGRIYHETHFSPLLQMQGEVREIAMDIVRRDGSRLPALVNATLRPGADGRPGVVRATVFDATDRRRYEQELLRARRREHEVASELQRSLLAGALPAAEPLAVEVFYRPAEAGLEVGGDWFDAFWLEEGRRVALVVGDVVGRGITAATAMGQLRSAIRALASTGLAPGPLLDALDRYAARHGVGRMATVVVADLDLDTRELRYAAAGHPPPVLVDPATGPRFLEDGRSLPLDAAVRAGPRAQATVETPAGGLLLLYTDGLVERRTRPLDEGLAALVAELRAAGGRPVLADLARRMEGLGHPDDVCLLSAALA